MRKDKTIAEETKESAVITDKAVPEAEEDENSLDRLGIDSRILKAIRDMGFDSASPIQAKAIPVELEGRDVIGQAQTGTGKTAAFGIPMLMSIDPKVKKIQGVILCPTRELAIQVSEELLRYSRYMHGIRILPVYGGQDIMKQFKGLKDGVQIVVGTPGRVMDHMRRGTIKCDHVKMIVLDEADEMLDMGFIDDMKTILSEMPEERQTVMFSATMPKEIQAIASEQMTDPYTVRIAKKELTVPKITQYYYDIKPSIKTEVLCRLIDLYEPKLSVVFCNTKKKVDELTDEMKSRGYYAEGLHGDLTQAQRDRVMKNFRMAHTEILIATDVMARGIDVEDIEAVFNYDIPQDDEYYVHRIGRTGRAGREGRAFSLVVGRDIYKLREIQKYCRTTILPQPVPTLDHDSSSMELAAALLKMRLGSEADETEDEFADFATPRLLSELDKKEGRGRRGEGRADRGGRGGRRGESRGEGRRERDHRHDDDDMVRLFINVGRKARITPGDLVGAIAGESGISGRMVGAIDIYDSYSFVDVDRRNAEKVLKAMKNVHIKGLSVHMEKALGRNERESD